MYHNSTAFSISFFGSAFASTLPIVMQMQHIISVQKVEKNASTCLVFRASTGACWTRDGKQCALLLWLPYSWLKLSLCTCTLVKFIILITIHLPGELCVYYWNDHSWAQQRTMRDGQCPYQQILREVPFMKYLHIYTSMCFTGNIIHITLIT